MQNLEGNDLLMEGDLKLNLQQPRIRLNENSDRNSSQQASLDEANTRNETEVAHESVSKCEITPANKILSSTEEREIAGDSDSSDLNRPRVCSNGLVAIAGSYLCSDDETFTGNAAGFINLKGANSEDGSSKDVENNNSVDVSANTISLTEKDTSSKKQEESLNCANLEDVQSKIIEVKSIGHTAKSPGKDGHTLSEPVNVCHTSIEAVDIRQVKEPVHVGHTPIETVDTGHQKEPMNATHLIKEPANIGHTSTKSVNATNPPVDSDTIHQAYAMSNIDKELAIICKEESTTQMGKSEEENWMSSIDKELEIICKEESTTQMGKPEDENSSSGDSLSDPDDESSSSETSTSSDTSSEDDLEDIRREIEREEEKVQTGPPKTRSEVFIKDLPEVPVLDVNIDDTVQLVELGVVFSIVESLVVVKAFPQTPALDSDSILFLENRSCLGLVFETFGPVQTPFYSVRFNRDSDISNKNVQVGDKVFYAPDIMEYSHYVFVAQLKRLKGSDASWEHDEEPPQEAIEYSDDEEEAKSKASRKKERMGKSGSADKNSPQKSEEAGIAQLQGTSKGNRKRTWQNRSKGQPTNQNQNRNQGTPHSNPVLSPHPAYRAPDNVWRGVPFMNHPTPEELHIGMRPIAPPRGVPPSRLPPNGPPPRVPFGIVPRPMRQFPATHPVHVPNPPLLSYVPPRPFTGGPGDQGPWPAGPPPGFVPRPPIPPPHGFHDPSFQGQNFMGIPPPPPPPPPPNL